MRHWMSKIAWLAALGLPIHHAASAGPLRDRIMERMAERRAAEGGAGRSAITDKGPFPLPAGVQVERDLAYGPDPVQKLDVYRPAHASGAPLILMVHGGGWRRGDKDFSYGVENKVTHWVGKGYVLVAVNYRMMPQANPVEQADDVARALSFAQSKAGSWGADPAKTVLMGHSSGSHLVSLIASDPTIATRQGARPWLGTVALDSAAFDVVQIMEGQHFGLYDKAFGSSPDHWREASPKYRLKGRLSAPLLAVCSSKRGDSCAQARAFAAKAESLGGHVPVLPVDLSHGEINNRLGLPGAYTEGVDAFLHSLGLS